MRGTKPLAFVVLLLVLCLLQPAHAGSIYDQEQRQVDAATGWLTVGGYYQQKLAQVVTAGKTGLLTAVELPIACFESVSFTIDIQAVTDGMPNGTVLSSTTLPAAMVPVANDPVFYQLPIVPVLVTADEQTAIVLTAPDDASCAIAPAPEGNPYAGGDAYFDSRPNQVGVWVPNGPPRYDMPFATVVAPA
jgi:hypothetical protein